MPEYAIEVGPGLRAATADVVALAFGRAGQRGCAGEHRGDDGDFKLACAIHGVGPLLGQRVAAGEVSAGPALDAWLLEQLARNRARLERVEGEARRTLTALATARLRSLPLKGAALLLRDGAEALAWRPITDIDLLIEPAPERALDLALARAGWCFRAAPWKHRVYAPCAGASPRDEGDYPIALEAHARVVEMFRGYRWDITAAVLRESALVDCVRLPSCDAMALHLAVHCSMALLEGMARAVQLLDLARAMNDCDPAWLLAVVRDAGLSTHARFLYPALAFVARETGDERCGAAAGALRAWVPAAMIEWAETATLYDVSWAALQEGPGPQRFGLWARNPAERARMLTHKLAPSPAVLAGERHAGDGPLAAQYARHYRHIARRVMRNSLGNANLA